MSKITGINWKDGTTTKVVKGKIVTKYSGCDYKGNVYFTSDAGESWIMHSLDGTSKEFGRLPSGHLSIIKEGH